jgi:hypothetical protein
MRNLLDDAQARSIDIIANEDTIEMVLNESAMQALSQAAAPTEPPSPAGPNPVLKEPEVPVAAVQVVPQESRIDQVPARAADHSPQGRADQVPERAADHSPQGRAEHPPELRADQAPQRRADPPERRAENRLGHGPEHFPEPSPDRRPPMSTLRFAVLLGVVAVGSAIGTAVTYLATTGALRPGHVATGTVSGTPVADVVPAAANAPAPAVAPSAVVTATSAAAPAAPGTTTAPAPATPVAPAATSAAPPPSGQPRPQPAPQPSPSTLASAPSSALSPATDSEPVRFVNPFDRKEVFEFPAGTSKADARDAVAELLYERAEDRQVSARGLVSGMGARHTTSASASAAPAARKAQP